MIKEIIFFCVFFLLLPKQICKLMNEQFVPIIVFFFSSVIFNKQMMMNLNCIAIIINKKKHTRQYINNRDIFLVFCKRVKGIMVDKTRNHIIIRVAEQ
jgi:hypothetical protein